MFLDLWVTDGGNNDTGWSNAHYDELLAKVLDAPTDAERWKVYNEMGKIIIDEMPILPLYHYTRARLIDPTVIGYKTTPLDNSPWKYADLPAL
ncbi:MAG: hypothetical protein J6386_06770 [Candidatus Synoicihabitans palmerolidicus]|nr:hypothetical protein [Candidatus Synoicihabitans palmerolidicus]